MSEFNFTVGRVFAGTDAQVKVGICATFSMTMDGPDGIIASYNDLKLMKSKEGSYYIDSPFRTYDGKDKEGNPKKMKVNVVKFFPEQKNWNKQDSIVRLVLDALENAQPKQNSKPAAATPTTNTKPVASKPASKEPW